MPIHDYVCKKCKQKSERFVFIRNLDSRQVCECGGTLKRLVSAPGAVKVAIKTGFMSNGVHIKSSKDARAKGVRSHYYGDNTDSKEFCK